MNTNTIRNIVIILLVSLTFSGCISTSENYRHNIELNPLQLQALQTQIFDVNKRMAFNSVMTVLQNEGYIINSADLRTGFITANSSTFGISHYMAYEPTRRIRFRTIEEGKIVRVSHQRKVSVTIVQQQTSPDKTRIRLNFIEEEYRNSVSVERKQIKEGNIYQKTFNAIRQQIFIGNSLNNTTPPKNQTKTKQKKKL